MRVIAVTPLNEIRAQEQEEKKLREVISQLEVDNATISYELMMAHMSNEESQMQHAELLYQLMQKGVL